VLSGTAIAATDAELRSNQACFVQIKSGLVTRASMGQLVVVVDVKSLSDGPLKTFILAALIPEMGGEIPQCSTRSSPSSGLCAHCFVPAEIGP
jgi:hypothetical protein